MKSTFFKTRIFFVFFFGLLSALAMVSCQTKTEMSPILHDKLANQWQLTSIAHSGSETIGNAVISSSIKFSPSTSAKGKFDWTVSYRGSNADETLAGSYEINEANKEMTLEGTSGKLLKMRIELNDNQLMLSGQHDNGQLVLKALRNDPSTQKLITNF